MHQPFPRSEDGFLPLRGYGVLGDGRSTALIGEDGGLDWWAVPGMDDPPLFDRLWHAPGGFFMLAPDAPFTIERNYKDGSNVLETIFTTADGQARLNESINSGQAGRLPWCELARRVEGIAGTVRFRVEMRFAKGDTRIAATPPNDAFVFHHDGIDGFVLASGGVTLAAKDATLTGHFTVAAGQRETIGIVAGRGEPLIKPDIADIDRRIDVTDKEWRDWSSQVQFIGSYKPELLRSALALKLLLFSPTGAIIAAPTSSLPEKDGGDRTYDYRFAWVRDCGYSIKAFLSLNQWAEAKTAFAWLIAAIARNGPRVVYTLDGMPAPDARKLDRTGWRQARPVRIGNVATRQHQHGIYGDALEIAYRFAETGGLFDTRTAAVLENLADLAARHWHRKDAGIWELAERRHYTMSKVSCWQALDRAILLARQDRLPKRHLARWTRERDRVTVWIDVNCWSDKAQSYMAWAGSDQFDASLALAVRFSFPRRERLRLTMDAIDRELGTNGLHYRASWMRKDEHCFLACSLWLVIARLMLGERARAEDTFTAFLRRVGPHLGVLPEMIDPKTGDFFGNMPLGLTHLSMVQAILALNGQHDIL